jgi:uncharacterized protein YndB with AHSA1/START domain
MVRNRIEREVLIDAPVEVVWSIVTEPQHVGSWLSDSAEIDSRPGGEAIISWEEHGAAGGRVERVEPPYLFSFRWITPVRAGDPGLEVREDNSTLVEFQLTAEGEGTRLCVVESGFAQLDGSEEANAGSADNHERGWAGHLDDLRDYVVRVRTAA